MASINDFRLPNGNTDWTAYRQAEVNDGERCYQCYSYIIYGKSTGSKGLCASCQALSNTCGEVNHDSYIRCPSCGNTEDITQWDNDSAQEKYEEGSHVVSCSECEYEYEIETHVSYSYTSPALLAVGGKETANDGD
jgi:hypothetical protein